MDLSGNVGNDVGMSQGVWGHMGTLVVISQLEKRANSDIILLKTASQENPENQMRNPRQHSEFGIFQLGYVQLPEVSRV